MAEAFRDVVNAKVRQKLMSGLPTTIATRAYLFPDDSVRKPLALSAQTCRVVFDLWDEVFRIELIQGGKRKKTVAVNVEGVMRNCTETRRLPLSSLDLLQPLEQDQRLKELREAQLVDHQPGEGYALSEHGRSLLAAMEPMMAWAVQWWRATQG